MSTTNGGASSSITEVPPPPFHVLMAFPPTTNDNPAGSLLGKGSMISSPLLPPRRRVFDRRFERDYLAKRYKAYQPKPTPTSTPPTTTSSTTSSNDIQDSNRKVSESAATTSIDKDNNRTSLSPSSSSSLSVWLGASQVERALIDCCEVPEEDDNDDYDDVAGLGVGRGALDRKKEVQFVTILARDCHILSSRSLALAILERTLIRHRIEQEEKEEEHHGGHDDSDDDENEGEDSGEDDDEDEDEEEVAMEDDDWKPGSSVSSRRRKSPRTRRGNQRRNHKNTVTNEDGPNLSEMDDDTKEDPDRLDAFLAVGGLRILNRWLTEASTSITVTVGGTPKQPPVGSSDNNNRTKRLGTKTTTVTKPSPMRPLAFPILRILEHIPFHKKLVMESKINKQIKKFGKYVDAVLEVHTKGKHHPNNTDLEGWTVIVDPSGTNETKNDESDKDENDNTDIHETAALEKVHDAIEGVKKTWEAMAAKRSVEIVDPFDSLKTNMRNKLDILVSYEAGEILERPDWLEDPPETKTKEPSKKRKLATAAGADKKPNTQQLAAKERQSEREDLQKRLKAVEDESRKRLAKLREQLRKRHEESFPASNKKKLVDAKVGEKRVKWKDGLSTKHQRNRKLLEDVLYIESREELLLAAAADDDTSQEGSSSDVGGGMRTEEGNDRTGDDPLESDDVIDDMDEDLFS